MHPSFPHTLAAEFYKLKDELPDTYKTKDVKTEAKEQAASASAEKVVNDTPFSQHPCSGRVCSLEPVHVAW